jgi:uncharacterized protein YdeI (YjbR/CyaY-like superfamily)
MGKKDKRVDAYIAKAPDYAKPILTHIRAVVHEACPDVEEAIKWSTPSFMYRDSPLGMMAAFKAHCAIRFWNEKLVMGDAAGADGNGALSRLTSLSDLPSKKVLGGYVKKAMELKEQGVKPPKGAAKPKKALPVPKDLKAALEKNKKALAAFDDFSPSHRREYIEWITGAKSDETRQRRLVQAIEWMAEGKSRHWKYM